MRIFPNEFGSHPSIDPRRWRIEYSSVIRFWLRFVQSQSCATSHSRGQIIMIERSLL
ncbi:MAG: hypothetical protein M3Z67_06835 [Commensalibacter sp.]|nr:hypothetical protein [Commensalibacter sp.]